LRAARIVMKPCLDTIDMEIMFTRGAYHRRGTSRKNNCAKTNTTNRIFGIIVTTFRQVYHGFEN